jgi:hypothetical protein
VTETRANSKCAPRRRAIGTVRLSPWECCDGAGRGFRTRGTQVDRASRVGRIRRRRRGLERRRLGWMVAVSEELQAARGCARLVAGSAGAKERRRVALREGDRSRQADRLPRRARACRRPRDARGIRRNHCLRSVQGSPAARGDVRLGSRFQAPARVRLMRRARRHRRNCSDLWVGLKPCGALIGFGLGRWTRLCTARAAQCLALHGTCRAPFVAVRCAARGHLTKDTLASKSAPTTDRNGTPTSQLRQVCETL